jgi:uncharacterized repeat protein (TIGR01451 family)
MKSLLNLLRYVPKRFAPVIALAVAAAIPAVIVMAWGPSRATFTTASPAPYVTFNSITDNPVQGDERNFMQVKASDAPNSAYADDVTVQSGKEYDVFVYYHNNAASNLNASGVGIAHGAYVKAQIPGIVGADTKSVAYVGATNANPKEVWDDVSFKSASGEMSLSYVPGSAHIYSKGAVNGQALADSVVTSGAPIGYDALNGDLPGCNDFAGYVVLKVKATQPNFTFSKKVAKADTTDPYTKSVSVKPGDKVEYQLSYANTGDTQQDNVTIKDILPAGTTYLAGSTKLYNANYPNGLKISDNVAGNGVNIGAYGAKSNAVVVFQAQVAANDALAVCGDNVLHNIAEAATDNGSKGDSADVTVPKVCQPPEAKYACTGIGVAQISRTQFGFTATSTIENADFVTYTYIVRDANGAEVTRIDGSKDQVVSYTQATAGKYSVEANLVVKVNGTEKTVTSAACKKNFEVTEQPVAPVYTCESLQLIQKVSRDTFTFKVTPHTEGNSVSVKEYAFDFGDGQTKVVSVGNETQTHTYAKPGDYTVKVSVAFNVDNQTVTGVTSDACSVKVNVEQVPPAECKPGIPVGDERCTPTNECKPGVPMGSASCNEQPTPPTTPGTPSELPSTGPETIVGGVFGTSALGLGVHTWWNSRRALRDAIAKR